MRLGIGVGWNPVEYAALEQDWKVRGRRQAEQIELMNRLWGVAFRMTCTVQTAGQP